MVRKINIEDIIGKKYGKLTIIQEVEPIIKISKRKKRGEIIVKHRRVKCLCECGNELVTIIYHLTRGKTKSCGCIIKGTIKPNEILEKYNEFNYSVPKVSKHFNISKAKVRRELINLGVDNIKRYVKFDWTEELVREEALKYTLKSNFRTYSRSAYNYALNNNFLDEVCSHMKVVGNSHRRMVYVYEFEDKSVYVGLTMDKDSRHHTHLNSNKSPVFKHMTKTNLNPIHKQITDYIDYDKAQEIEINLIEQYRKDNWNVLNILNGGQLGGWTGRYTEKKLYQEALNYTLYTKFVREKKYLFRKIKDKGYDYMLTHLKRKEKKVSPPKKSWTDESHKQHMEKIQKKGLEVLKTMKDNNIPTNAGRPLDSVETIDDFINKPINIEIRNMVLGGYSVRHIEKTLNVSKTTIVKVRKTIYGK
jgi:predicted GIY-YIG superfamily endonuclease